MLDVFALLFNILGSVYSLMDFEYISFHFFFGFLLVFLVKCFDYWFFSILLFLQHLLELLLVDGICGGKISFSIINLFFSLSLGSLIICKFNSTYHLFPLKGFIDSTDFSLVIVLESLISLSVHRCLFLFFLGLHLFMILLLMDVNHLLTSFTVLFFASFLCLLPIYISFCLIRFIHLFGFLVLVFLRLLFFFVFDRIKIVLRFFSFFNCFYPFWFLVIMNYLKDLAGNLLSLGIVFKHLFNLMWLLYFTFDFFHFFLILNKLMYCTLDCLLHCWT